MAPIPTSSNGNAKKVWFITGASSGFGYATTLAALQRGDKVVATLRTPTQISDLEKKYDSKQLLILKLDVTKPSEIESTFSQAIKHFGRIDVLLSNAGSSFVSEVEGTPDAKAREIFEVLFWGAANVTKEAVKCFKEQKPIGGKVLQVDSMVGVKGLPGLAYYSAAKAALLAFTDAFGKELKPEWNIQMSNVCPGPFTTKMATGKSSILPPFSGYEDPNLPTNKMREFIGSAKVNGDPDKAAAVFLRLSDLKQLPSFFPLHTAAVDAFKEAGGQYVAAAEEWKSWSNDVCVN